MMSVERAVVAVRRATTRCKGVLAACAASLACVAGVHAQEPVRAVPVADRVWFVQGAAALGSSANRNFISNAAFVATRDGVVVVDALGSPELAKELLAEIDRVTGGQPVRFVIVTHYHADHIYGLQALKARDATVIAHAAGREYLNSDTAALRLEASRRELAPWVDEDTRLVPADRWIDGDTAIEVGGERFEIRHAGPSHTPEDLVVWVPGRRVLFAGDLVFRGRIPFVGQADSRHWIATLDRLLADRPEVIVTGHGPASREAMDDLRLTRDYLAFLRESMGAAARDMEPFDEAYSRTDWSRFAKMPLFGIANRMNAYNTYLLMERETTK
jgi:glyoxylase-like metal-dependent hydrolase (beta-lactamase superfamily II)